MAKMGDWRENKDEEIELDGIGGVNIMVKADIHRSGMLLQVEAVPDHELTTIQESTSPAMLSKIRPRRKDLQRWPSALVTRSMAFRTTSSGTLTPRKSPETPKGQPKRT